MAGLHCILSFLVIDSRRISMSFIEFGFFPIPFHYITNTSDSSELKMGSKRILSIIPIDWHEFLLLFCSVMMNRVPSEGRWLGTFQWKQHRGVKHVALFTSTGVPPPKRGNREFPPLSREQLFVFGVVCPIWPRSSWTTTTGTKPLGVLTSYSFHFLRSKYLNNEVWTLISCTWSWTFSDGTYTESRSGLGLGSVNKQILIIEQFVCDSLNEEWIDRPTLDRGWLECKWTFSGILRYMSSLR